MKSERTDEMKTEAPQSTISGASPEDMLGKHPKSSRVLRRAVIVFSDDNSRRTRSKEMVMLGEGFRTVKSLAIWLGS